MSIKYFEQSLFKTGTTQLPLSFDNQSLTSDPEKCLQSLGIPKLVIISQVHGHDILEFSYQELLLKCSEPINNLGEADAVIINGVGGGSEHTLAFGIRTADCLPVIIQSAHKIALLHAGWRGLAAGIIERTVAKFQNTDSAHDQLHFYIGPAAKDCCYEVGPEVLEALGSSGSENKEVKKIDLQKLAEACIRAVSHQGVIEIDKRCTICNPLLHSYRRDKTRLRNFTFIVL